MTSSTTTTKFEYPTYEAIYKVLKKKIRKDFGTRCKDFCINCATCQAYMALDIMRDIIDLESDWK